MSLDTLAEPVEGPVEAGHANRPTPVDPPLQPEPPAVSGPSAAPTSGRRGWIVPILIAIGACGGVYLRGMSRLEADARSLYELAREQVVGKPAPVIERVIPSRDFKPWDGLVTVTEKQRGPLGMNVVVAEPQDKPILLEMSGTTDYDQNNLAKIRPLFDARVQKVFKSTGQTVKKGEPLVELFSNELLAAKNDCRTKYVQWDHDLKMLESRRPLVDKGAITQVAWAETQNAEKKSRVEYIQVHEKLIVLGLSNDEVNKLLVNLSDNNKFQLGQQEAQDLARMSVKSPIDGVVIERNVVSGNYYDANDVLMVVSPMDHLWVYANVFEKDQAKVALGMSIDVQFPFLEDAPVRGKVEGIDNRVDPITRSVRIRVSIPNPSTRLKADMLVRAFLEIPPGPGLTRIPRTAMSVIDGAYHVFVQRPDDSTKFERRTVELEQERTDSVIVRRGIKPGDQVVTNGSLIMAQLYEDLASLNTGTPAD